MLRPMRPTTRSVLGQPTQMRGQALDIGPIENETIYFRFEPIPACRRLGSPAQRAPMPSPQVMPRSCPRYRTEARIRGRQRNARRFFRAARNRGNGHGRLTRAERPELRSPHEHLRYRRDRVSHRPFVHQPLHRIDQMVLPFSFDQPADAKQPERALIGPAEPAQISRCRRRWGSANNSRGDPLHESFRFHAMILRLSSRLRAIRAGSTALSKLNRLIAELESRDIGTANPQDVTQPADSPQR